MMHTHSAWIRGCRFFRSVDDQFVCKLAVALEQKLFGPNEHIIHYMEEMDAMYIVKAGVCACRGQICVPGNVFGDDMILSLVQKKEQLRFYSSRTLSFTEVCFDVI